MRPREFFREYKMTLVSMKFPEEIPWFKASQRARVVVTLAGIGCRMNSVDCEQRLSVSAGLGLENPSNAEECSIVKLYHQPGFWSWVACGKRRSPNVFASRL